MKKTVKNLLWASLIFYHFLPQVLIAQAYVRSTTNAGLPVSWFETCLPFSFDAMGSNHLSMAQVQSTVQISFMTWQNERCTSIAFSNQGVTQEAFGFELGADNENLIIFRSTRDEWVHDSQILALTTLTLCQNDSEQCPAGTILDADIELNEAHFFFTSSEQSPQFDLENTLTHEIGHFIGFDHNSQEESTMFASAPFAETKKRSLEQVDVDGLCTVYPLEGNKATCSGRIVIGLPYPAVEADGTMMGSDFADASVEPSLKPVKDGCDVKHSPFKDLVLWYLISIFSFMFIRWTVRSKVLSEQ
jgi:hypothetical protein